MELNIDCIRAVMLGVEKMQKVTVSPYKVVNSKKVDIKALFDELPDQKPEDIIYSAIVLNDAGYIKADVKQTDSAIGNIYIHRITYKGHEFLEEIRDTKLWSKTKKVLTSMGSFGLSTISEIARRLISNLANEFIKHV